MANKYPTLMVACVDPKLKKTIYKSLPDCVVAIIYGKEIKLSDLLDYIDSQNEKIKSLELKQVEMATKFNALLAAYKANNAKTAMQIMDLEENI